MKLPEVLLGILCDIVIGATPSRSQPAYWGGNNVWLTIRELNGGTIYDSREHITALGIASSASKLIPAGTLLFSFKLSIGKMGIAGCDLYTNEAIAALPIRPGIPLERDYLSYTLQHLNVAQGADVAVKGALLNKKKLAILKIPLPPLSEQRRIVKILQQADALRKKRAEADAKAERILPALFIKMFGDPITNLMGWDIVPMSKLYEISPNYGTMIPPNSDEGGWLDLRVANIKNDSLNLESRKYLNLPLKEVQRYEVRNGDLLVARAIGSVEHLGKCIVAYPGSQKWAFDSHLMRVRFQQNLVHPEFVRSFLLTPGGRQLFLNKTRKSAVQFNINTKEFGSILLPLPPLKLQHEFVGKLEKLRILKTKQTEVKQFTNNLFETLLQRAFSGNLTAEWREAHMSELLAEMEQQAKILRITAELNHEQLALIET